jgi:hypothetical protein
MPARRTPDQWQALVRQQEQGPLSIAAFCRKKSLSLSSFHRWRRTVHQQPQDSGFVELQPRSDAEAAACGGTLLLDLDLPGGGRLRLRFEP